MNLTIILKQIGFLIVFLIASFILVHFLAIFGLFLALALPVLHLFFYPHIFCFWCRISKKNHNFRHSLIDSLLITVLTFFSIGVVYLEYTLITHNLNPELPLIASFTIPTKNQYTVGDVITVPIELTNIPAAINVFQADLSFDPQLIQVINLSTDSTFAKFFVQKEFDNSKGYVRFSGGVPNPGYQNSSGLIGTVFFRATNVGATELSYLDSSLVLANDGRGTNLLSDYPKIPLIILPKDQNASPIPSDITIRSQVQGETDKTVLSFTEYANDLPMPYPNIEGASTVSATPIPQKSSIIRVISIFDSIILSKYTQIIKPILN